MKKTSKSIGIETSDMNPRDVTTIPKTWRPTVLNYKVVFQSITARKAVVPFSLMFLSLTALCAPLFAGNPAIESLLKGGVLAVQLDEPFQITSSEIDSAPLLIKLEPSQMKYRLWSNRMYEGKYRLESSG